MRLAQAIVFVGDMARMKGFYGSVLGLPVLEDGADWARFDGGGCVLALHALPPAIATTPPVERTDTWIKLCFHADDVASERTALVQRGVQMKELHRFGSVTFCDGVDPEGNVFQITSR